VDNIRVVETNPFSTPDNRTDCVNEFQERIDQARQARRHSLEQEAPFNDTANILEFEELSDIVILSNI